MPSTANLKAGTDCPERRLYAQESRLFGFSGGLWREKGVGDAIMLKDVKTERVRFVFRQEKTREILANHYVIEHEAYCILRRNVGNEDSWVWSARDRAEEKPKVQRFALKLATVPLAESFKACFDHAKELNSKAEGFAEEQELYAQRSVLYTFHGSAWRDTGYGKAWILRHGRTGRARFVFRREEKKKIVANHYIAHHRTDCELRPNAGSADCWAWAATDLAGDAAKPQRFALRFVSSDLAAAFKSHFDRAKGEGGLALKFEAEEEEMYAQGSCRLYLFVNDAWKDQGAGAAKLLKHTGTGRRRFAFLSAGAAELVASHDVAGLGAHCNLKPNAGSNDCWAWSVEDPAHGVRRYALKFHGADAAAKFRVAFDAAKSLGARAAGAAAAVGRGGGKGPAAGHGGGAVGFTVTRSDKEGYREHFVLQPGPAGGAVQLGRSPLSEVCVALNGVSNLHAELRAADAGSEAPLCVRDLSRNGTAMQLPSGKKVLLKMGSRAPMPHGAMLLLPMMTRSAPTKSGLIQVIITVELDNPELDKAEAAPPRTAPRRAARPPAALEPTTKTRTKAAPARPPQQMAPLPAPLRPSELYTGLEGHDKRASPVDRPPGDFGPEGRHDRRASAVGRSRADASRPPGDFHTGLEGRHDRRASPAERPRGDAKRPSDPYNGLEGRDRRVSPAERPPRDPRTRQAALRTPVLPFSAHGFGKRPRRDYDAGGDDDARGSGKRSRRDYDAVGGDDARGRGVRLRQADAWDTR